MPELTTQLAAELRACGKAIPWVVNPGASHRAMSEVEARMLGATGIRATPPIRIGAAAGTV
eukprot:14998945-Alexandrium_andersonii.AAC.1